MPITKSQTPNEFLVRWSDAGQIQGAHIVFREAVIEDGTELTSRLLPAQPVAMAGASGFPLGDVLADVQASALATIDARDAEIATLKASQQTTEAERDAALARAAELQTQLDAIHPPAVNGVPQQISPGQGELQLLREGLLDDVRAVLADPYTPPEMQIAFARATVWERQSPSVIAMLGMLGKTDAEADAFFVAASQIRL